MKKLIVLLLGISLVISGCGKQEEHTTEITTEVTTENTTEEIGKLKEYTIKGLNYSVPENWEGDGAVKDEKGYSTVYFYPENGMLYIYADEVNAEFTSQYQKEYFDSVQESINESLGEATIQTEEPETLNEFYVVRFSGNVKPRDESIQEQNLKGIAFCDSGILYSLMLSTTVDINYEKTFDVILNSMYSNGLYKDNNSEIDADTKEKDENNTTETEEVTEAQSEGKVTVGMTNALKKAKSYLDSSAFSYTGLIEQLEYNKFTTEEATYAADHCGADWKEQALKKAKNYLDSSAFSYTGLIEQLEYNGFTTEEATYGADKCGADWKEQAVKKGASYLKSGSFSRQGLIDQLEYNGFSHEEAEYGATENGL